jgi:hypothetical protein
MHSQIRALLTLLAILTSAHAAAQIEPIRVNCPTGSPVLSGDTISCPGTAASSPSLRVTCPTGRPALNGDAISCSGTGLPPPALRVICPAGRPALIGDAISCAETALPTASAPPAPPAASAQPAPTPPPAPSAPPPPPVPPAPPALGQNFCTDGVDQIVDVKWPLADTVPTNQRTKAFTKGRVAAFRISAPVSLGNEQLLGKVNLTESPGGGPFALFRQFTISRNACDFKSGNYLYNGIDSPATFLNGTYFVNNPAQKNTGALFNIQPGEVLYINVRHYGSCNLSAGCDIDLDLYKAK